MPHILILLLAVLGSAQWMPLQAQSFQAYVKAGEEAMRDRDYYAALFYYELALERKADAAVWYASAEAARQFYALEIAATYYQQVCDSEAAAGFPEAAFWLAMCKKGIGQYTEAAHWLERYLSQSGLPAARVAQAKLEQQACEMALSRDQADPLWTVRRMGRELNTPYSEFGAVITGDSLFFSSYRFDWPKDRHRPARKQARLMLSKGQGRGRLLPKGFNADTLHTAHTAFSPAGDRMYFTVCRFKGGAAIQCQLAYRDRDRRGRWRPEYNLLPASINLPGYTATQPAAAYDSLLKRQLLYFVSDRPGGSGGLDLWQVGVPKAGEGWPDPKPVTELNTPLDELTPYYHTPSGRLFFSSDGYQGWGGYDVFVSQRTADSLWAKPTNLGADINSSYNDVYYFLQKDGQRGLFSSNRPGGAYLDERSRSCCQDIFAFERIPPKPVNVPPTADEVVSLPDKTPELPQPKPEPVYRDLSDFLPLALYFDNDEPDKRTRRTTTRQSYGDTYARYYPRRAEYHSRYLTNLSGERAELASESIDAFFDDELRGGYEKLQRFSEILLERLQTGHKVEIFIKGYTSPRAQSDYNLFLGQRRVSSARLHFDTWREGTFQAYLASGQLIISEVSFGETKAARDVADALDNERESIYSPAAARERRVEIVEVKEGKQE